jgi:recombination protein RecA
METLSAKDKLKAVELACVEIEKEHGAGTISKLGNKRIVPLDFYSTGVFGIDRIVCGIGGIPRSRITEIFGPEGSGKTTIALQTVADAQRRGDLAAYIDAEHSLDLGYANNLGVDTKNMFLSQPDYGEQALDICDKLISSGGVGIVVVDSVAALVPKAELDGEMEDQNMGLHARLMSKAMRKLAGITNKNNVALVFINQLREKIGVMFGNPETTTGGRALRFYSSLRLDIRRVQAVKEGDEVVANLTKIKAIKNKVANPYRETEVPIVFGKGMDGVSNLMDFAEPAGIIEKSGSWYSYKGERLGQGKNNAADFIRSDAKLLAEIRGRVEAALTKAEEADKKETK